jgi:DNA-binding beta-propeller fold protein YncE
MRVRRKGPITAVAAAAIAVGLSLQMNGPDHAALSAPRLLAVEEFPAGGEMCLDPTGMMAGLDSLLAAVQTPVYAAGQEAGGVSANRQPLRQVRDTDPMYSSIAVDTRLNEVFLLDPNLWSIRVFNRLDNTPTNAPRTEPKRVIVGPNTNVQYNSNIYVDPRNGDIYSVENDTGDSIYVWAGNSNGDVKPLRRLHIPHYGYDIEGDETKQELYLTVHLPPQVVVYSKTASGEDKPLRVLTGPDTRMSDTHGLALDVRNQLLFVNNWGRFSNFKLLGGRFEEPSITVFPLNANGNMAPLRVIQGPRTLLNWPAAMTVDPATGDLYVANNVGQSILVFSGTAEGDVAPKRVIKGDKTGLSYPLAVVIDRQNNELWASNFGNSSAAVYSLTANGNAEPLRTIRSAPKGKQSLRNGGKAVAITYDPKREELLVHN